MFFGFKLEPYDNFKTREPEQYKLHLNIQEFLKHKVRLYFKRELPALCDTSSLGIPVLPADYTNVIKPYTINSKEEFLNRDIDLFTAFGKILQEIEAFGHNMFTSEKQHDIEIINNKRKQAILLIHNEWFERTELDKYTNNTKTMLDLYGSGMKCFRNIESSSNTVSFKQDPNVLIHTYPWTDGFNCVTLPNKQTNLLDVDASCSKILEYLRGDKQELLYDIYLNSTETNSKYEIKKYIKDHVIHNIKLHLK